MVIQSEALIEAVERLLQKVNEGCDRAGRTCSKLDRLQKGTLDYGDGLGDLADELEFIAAKVESLREALKALAKPCPQPPPAPRPPM